MYQLIVTHGAHTYSLFGNSLDIKDYPTVPVGAFVCIPATGDLFYMHGPKTGFDLDDPNGEVTPDEPSEEPNSATSIFGEGVMGDIIFGEE